MDGQCFSLKKKRYLNIDVHGLKRNEKSFFEQTSEASNTWSANGINVIIAEHSFLCLQVDAESEILFSEKKPRLLQTDSSDKDTTALTVIPSQGWCCTAESEKVNHNSQSNPFRLPLLVLNKNKLMKTL